jgi:hypothetical protein
MKKFALALVALSALSTPLFAKDIYAGLALGPSTTNDDCSGLTNCDKTGTAYKGYVGIMMSPVWAIEASYGRLGQVSADSGPVHVSLTPTAFQVGGAYWGTVNDQLSAVVRLGASFGKVKVDGAGFGSSVSKSDQATNPYFGVGMAYAVSPVVGLTADLDFNKVEFEGASSNVRGLTLGVKFKF